MTMKFTILTISMMAGVFTRVLPQNTHANWAKHIECSENSAFNNVICDGETVIANGYWFLNGEYDGITLPNSLSSNALIAKMDLKGNVLWHTTMTGEGYETFFDLALDNQKK